MLFKTILHIFSSISSNSLTHSVLQFTLALLTHQPRCGMWEETLTVTSKTCKLFRQVHKVGIEPTTLMPKQWLFQLCQCVAPLRVINQGVMDQELGTGMILWLRYCRESLLKATLKY